ncbi:MAG: acetate kinase [Chloroflexi bacterium]|jgi:acetate kinase|nr:acetate kinase [Chloroflexota bacterium]
MKVLVINSGSSSIKYQLFDMTDRTVLASGLLEQIGEPSSCLTHHTRDANSEMRKITKADLVANHQAGFQLIGTVLTESGVLENTNELFGIGHRVVHGGEAFREPTLINEKVIDTIRRLSPLAPLHNPANLVGIEVALKQAPDVPQVAVFDTAFHQSIPVHAFRYALPEELYQRHRIRRYGFHGTSHYYVAKQAAEIIGHPIDSLNLITVHLGNGASITAIENGKSIDTSMGMTPLEGLIMGTRSGDIDPAIIFFLGRHNGNKIEEVESLLNKESGLRGICGLNDMREIMHLVEAGDDQAKLAIDMYCYRIKKYIGAYYAVLGQLDALVYTGGIGEHSAAIRSGGCQGLANLGIELDERKNTVQSEIPAAIQSENSRVKILVIPTNEELEIAEQTIKRIQLLSGDGM